MEECEMFRKQAIKDQKTSKLLFKNEDFGNSAYHMQQCLEKHTKSLILKYKISNNLIKSHMPIHSLTVELIKKCRTQQNKQNSYAVRKRLLEMLSLLEKVEACSYQNEELKILIWKQSLGIPNSIEENKKLEDLKHKAMKPINIANYTKDEYKELKAEIKQNKTLKQCEYFLYLFRLDKFIEIILRVFSHETIGRYPIKINGKNSANLYIEYKDGLENLLNDANDVCNNYLEKKYTDISFL